MNKPTPEEWLDRVKEVMSERGCNAYVAMNEVEEETRKKYEEILIQEQND